MKRLLFLLLCVLSAQVMLAQNYQSNDSVPQLQKRSNVNYGEFAKYEMSKYDADYLLARAGRMQRRSSTFRCLAIASGIAGGIVALAMNNKAGRAIGISLAVTGTACEVTSILYQHKSGISLEASGAKVMLKF